ncbi:MAG: hypothetical protein ACRDYZ_05955 [Acidimicrobiales bacterium]
MPAPAGRLPTPPTPPGPPGLTVVDVPLGRRVAVLGDLLLPPAATPSSTALAADVAHTLDRWEGPGTAVVCGNLFAGHCGRTPLTADEVRRTLEDHRELAGAVERFTAGADRRFLVLPGWRDGEVASEPAVVTQLYRLGVEVTGAVELRLCAAPASGTCTSGPARRPPPPPASTGPGCRAWSGWRNRPTRDGS